MKNIYFYSLLLFSFFTLHSQVQNYNVGDVVADFTVTDIHGEEYNLYSLTAAGKYIFIDFSFTTCGSCRDVAPIFNEFYDKYGCGNGEIMCFTMFGINNDHDNNVENFENTYGGSFNHAPAISIDGGATAVDSNFGINLYPTTCIINPENKIIVLDIWPINSIASYEAKFPSDFNPDPMSCSSASVNDFTSSHFSIFPNPNSGKYLTITLDKKESATVNIYNLLGKKVASYALTEKQQIIETDLASGSYLIAVITLTNKSTKKLIVR